MTTNMIDYISMFLKKRKKLTFTYFIPTPPQRSSGYQESQFDSVIEKLAQDGNEIIDIKMQSISNEQISGTLVIILYYKNHKKSSFNIRDLETNTSDDIRHSSDKPEGLYYLD